MVDHLNEATAGHIITIEDPVEFFHLSKRCVITHRQIGRDVATYPEALRAALREDPDVMLVGELRDVETISLALTAAETGHLVLATLHTRGAVSAINRIIDVFPSRQQHQVRTMLAESLTAVISQELVQKKEGGRVPCVEVLSVTPGVGALIREGKTHQIENVMQTSASEGMCTRAVALERLARRFQLVDVPNLRATDEKSGARCPCTEELVEGPSW
jgi:twitching motility protein PilT